MNFWKCPLTKVCTLRMLSGDYYYYYYYPIDQIFVSPTAGKIFVPADQ